MGVVLRLILSFNISSFYVYLRGLPLYIKTPEQSRAARLTRIRRGTVFLGFLCRYPGFGYFRGKSRKGLHAFPDDDFLVNPRASSSNCGFYGLLSGLPGHLLTLITSICPPPPPPPPSRMLNSWRCASPRSGGVSYRIFIFPCWASALHGELFCLLKSIHCRKSS